VGHEIDGDEGVAGRPAHQARAALALEADREKPAGIAVSPIPADGLGEAINDRLRRAAGFVG
jgi:hypothetical protein